MINLRTLAGKKIPAIGLGAMPLDEYGKMPEKGALELLRYAVKAGIKLIDTADVYGLGHNEELIGKAFSSEQKKNIIIATKAGCTRPGGTGWGTDGRPEHIKKAVAGSLQRLGVKQIYLYQLHAPDSRLSLMETIKAFKELQDADLIKHFGVSNFSLAQLQQAEKIMEIVSVQNQFSLAYRYDEWELLPYLTKNNIAYLPYFPLGGKQRNIAADGRLQRLAQALGHSPTQVALAWIVNKWPTAIPIPGTTNKKHLEENLKAGEIELSEKVMKELEKST
ncbi:MAG: aldo/keto reductase [Nanoarchaeota archaeon]